MLEILVTATLTMRGTQLVYIQIDVNREKKLPYRAVNVPWTADRRCIFPDVERANQNIHTTQFHFMSEINIL